MTPVGGGRDRGPIDRVEGAITSQHIHTVSAPRGGAPRPAAPVLLACAAALGAVVTTSACMVGPGYVRPPIAVADDWAETGHPAVRQDPSQPVTHWWEVFSDPVLTHLVDTAVAQNLSLRSAGVRVLAAQARRGIAIGGLFPQEQLFSASYQRLIRSENAVTPFAGPRSLNGWQAGFDAAWELDLWGKFRRAIEASDADLLGAVASYDDVLVSLVAEVATTYLTLRTLDERLAVADDNVRVQHDSLEIARVRFEAGGTSELDVQQAATLLHDTEATIPLLETLREQSVHSLCVLLGLPPQDLAIYLDGTGRVPQVPISVAVGLPADLLRRRPDVRSAELAAEAQSARIGVSAADLLPAFALVGSIGLSAEDAAKFFAGHSFTASAGPSVQWPILNYGRIANDVRLQDATFQELATNYQNAVLVAQQEVEDALVGYVRGAERVARLGEAVDAAHRAVDLSLIQYREGATDYTSVLNSQQAKLRLEDEYVNTRGLLALNVVSLYKALGGGWELRDGNDFVPAETREAMQQRTRWGGLISPEARARDVDHAADDLEPHPWWHWRTWWPKW
jgi:NodT family efflux transporter outer membrane factor (OMF) lipoprotein